MRNLEERVKIDPLKNALREIFSEFGNVIDIVAKTNLKAKGQAFIVYDNADSAKQAAEEADGFDLFEKPMQVALARSRSDATVQKFGTEEEFEQHKRRRAAEKGMSSRLWTVTGRRFGSRSWANSHPHRRQKEGPRGRAATPQAPCPRRGAVWPPVKGREGRWSQAYRSRRRRGRSRRVPATQ